MAGAVRDTDAMIAQMAPVADLETYHFCTTTDAALTAQALPDALACFRESEGMSLILSDYVAHSLGCATDLPMRRITLSVHSALDGVGLTAAVSAALADAGISCNMVAAYHHDHVFVPEADAEAAMKILHQRSQA